MEELDSYVGLHSKYYPADIKKMIKLMKDTKIALYKDQDEHATKTEIRI
jgi:hypothetical protein